MDMRDIAKAAGVSCATVSRVIHGSKLVRPETADRVQRIIHDLKFFPNSTAVTLKYGRSGTYGLIIPDITNPFFPEFVKNFEKILVDHQQEMLIATTDFFPEQSQLPIRRMLIRKVDGVALLASEIETESIESFIHNRVPLVTMDRRKIGPGLSDVRIDNSGGIREAIDYLKSLNHTRIGYIGGSTQRTISDHRARAFIDAMRKFGLVVNPDFMQVGDYRITGGQSAMARLLTMRERPTAVLTANDLTAIGALRTLREKGLSVPGDFSVVGFDDIDFCEIITPPLTTIQLPRREFAQAFYRALEEAGKNPNNPGKQYTMGTRLVIRESVGPAPASSTWPR